MKKKNKINKLTILFIFLDICAAICFFIMYGPYSNLRNIYVTTAMQTRNHKYLANVFYSDEKISNIMDSNYFIGVNENVDLNSIIINTSEKKEYKDEYEEELLTRDKDNDLYKVINLKVGNANGYLIAIYDPTKVKLLRVKKFNAGTVYFCINWYNFTSCFILLHLCKDIAYTKTHIQ